MTTKHILKTFVALFNIPQWCCKLQRNSKTNQYINISKFKVQKFNINLIVSEDKDRESEIFYLVRNLYRAHRLLVCRDSSIDSRNVRNFQRPKSAQKTKIVHNQSNKNAKQKCKNEIKQTFKWVFSRFVARLLVLRSQKKRGFGVPSDSTNVSQYCNILAALIAIFNRAAERNER